MGKNVDSGISECITDYLVDYACGLRDLEDSICFKINGNTRCFGTIEEWIDFLPATFKIITSADKRYLESEQFVDVYDNICSNVYDYIEENGGFYDYGYESDDCDSYECEFDEYAWQAEDVY